MRGLHCTLVVGRGRYQGNANDALGDAGVEMDMVASLLRGFVESTWDLSIYVCIYMETTSFTHSISLPSNMNFHALLH